MRRKGIRLSFSLLFAMAGLLFFAGPASASGESIGSCVVEKLEHIMEEGHHDDGHHDAEHLFHSLHAEEGATEEEKKAVKKNEDKLERCLEAPSPIIPELSEVIWGGGAFLILFVVMVKKGFPAVKAAMDARADKIREDLDAAEKAKTDAQSVHADYEARLADAKNEASRLIDEARGAADQVRSDLVAKAEADISEMKSRASSEIEASRQQAIADLRAEVAGIALGAAEKVVQSSLDEDAQRRLVDQYIDEVAGS